jgi:diguanylate cyclase (GGDEF)-like protein
MKISPLWSGMAVAAAGLLLTLILVYQDQQRQDLRQQAEVAQELRLLRARVEGLLDKYLYLGTGLAAYVATHPDVSSYDFAALMQRIAQGDVLLRGVMLLRDDQPSHVYAPPPRVNSTSSALLRLNLPVMVPEVGKLRRWGSLEIDLDRGELLLLAGLPRSGDPLQIAVRSHDGLLLAGTPEVFAAAQVRTEIVLPDGRWSIAGRAGPPSDRWYWLVLLGGFAALLGGVLTWRWQTARVDPNHPALHDCLTGLPNRRLLQDRVQQACAAAARSRRRIVLMYLDLDNFKPVNDNYGHHAGDAVLCDVARRLHHCVRRSDTVARVSGDEFVLVLEELTDVAEAEAVADKVLTIFARPIVVGEHAFVLGCSIGMVAMEPGCDVDVALMRADNAMYRAKRDGKNSYRWYVPAPEQLNLEVAAEAAV